MFETIQKWTLNKRRIVNVSYLGPCPKRISRVAVRTGRRCWTTASSSVRQIGPPTANNSAEGILADTASPGRNVSTVLWQ